MEVLAQNFDTVLPEIEKSISSCDFLSIDFEFTGVVPSHGKHPTVYDSLQDRYESVLHSSDTFAPNQFGLSLFQKTGEKKYMATVYYFYIFSHPFGGSDLKFVCQSSSMQFLSRNGFDFNKWIRDGIPFLSREAEEKAIEGFKKSYEVVDLDLSVEDKAYLDKVKMDVEAWLLTDDDEMVLDFENAFRRRAVYQEIEQNYTQVKANPFELEDKRKTIKLSKGGVDPLLEKKEKLSKAVGFRKVIDLIIDSQKPLIGHNCFLDLMHLVRYFYKTPPKEVDEWLKIVHEIFPVIYDTKVIADDEKFKGVFPRTTLEVMFTAVQGKGNRLGVLEFEFPDQFPSYLDPEDTSSYHQAGYDAFVTGFVFLELANELVSDCPNYFETNEVKKFENQVNLYLLKPHLSLVGDNTPYIYKDVLALRVPPDMEQKEIFDFFKKLELKVNLKWHRSGTLFVKFFQEKNLKRVLSSIADANPPFDVYEYEDFINNRAEITEKPVPPTPKEKPRKKLIIDSPISKSYLSKLKDSPTVKRPFLLDSPIPKKILPNIRSDSTYTPPEPVKRARPESPSQAMIFPVVKKPRR